jgi:hypothetical protein
MCLLLIMDIVFHIKPCMNSPRRTERNAIDSIYLIGYNTFSLRDEVGYEHKKNIAIFLFVALLIVLSFWFPDERIALLVKETVMSGERWKFSPRTYRIFSFRSFA